MITVNKIGADWIALRRWATDQIAEATSVLVSPGLDERHSDVLRGQIAILYAMIDEVEPQIQPEVETENYG